MKTLPASLSSHRLALLVAGLFVLLAGCATQMTDNDKWLWEQSVTNAPTADQR